MNQVEPCRALPLVALAWALFPAVAGADWNATLVDDPKDFRVSSLAFDTAGRPAIAYGDDKVYYASWDGAWQLETVASPGVVSKEALEFDLEGNPAITYAADDGLVWLARHDGNEWLFECIAPGHSPSLAFEADGTPAIAFLESERIHIARKIAGNWEVRLEIEEGGPFSFAFEAPGRPALGYMDEVTPTWDFMVFLACFDGTVWNKDLLEWGIPEMSCYRSPSAACSPDGHCYFAWGSSEDVIPPVYLKIEGFGGASGPIIEEFDDSWGVLPSTAVDSAGRPGVCYENELISSPARRTIDLLLCDDTDCWTERVAEPGRACSMAFDPADRPSFSYFDDSLHALRYARFEGSGWSLDTVDEPSDSLSSSWLALDGQDHPGIAYSGRRDLLRYAYFDGSNWSFEPIDSGLRPRLAFDAGEAPNIFYLHRVNWDDELRFTRRVGASWETWTLSSNPHWDGHSLAMDAAGEPALSYYDRDVDELTLARWNGSGFDTEPVAAAGEYSALAFDAAGNPAVAYVRSQSSPSTHFIHYATKDGGTWTAELVEEAIGYFRGSISLVFDDSGSPLIAYVTWDGLRSLQRVGPDWQAETIDTTACTDVRLTLDAGGQPALIWKPGDLVRVARRAGTGWEIETVASEGNPGSLAFTSAGQPRATFTDGDLWLTTDTGPATLYRAPVQDLSPGWRQSALPLDSTNDEEGGIFPLETSLPGSARDEEALGAPLVLYRVLWPGDRPALNSLRVTKSADAIELSY